ncbi:MAG: cytochrome P450, partial [Pseudomonadota bacterium]
MALRNVSETAIEEHDAPVGPAHPPVFDVPPPADLTSLSLFTEGQPFDAYREMRERAPVCWHPEDFGAGFWALSRYDDIKQVEL